MLIHSLRRNLLLFLLFRTPDFHKAMDNQMHISIDLIAIAFSIKQVNESLQLLY